LELIIKHDGGKEEINISEGSVLLDILRDRSVFIESPCSGRGICGKCKVKIVKGLQEPSNSDREKLSIEELQQGIRLSCKVILDREMEIEVLRAENKMEAWTEGAGVQEDFQVDPVIKIKCCSIDKPSLEDQRDDLKRLSEACELRELTVPYSELAGLSSTLRAADFKVAAVLHENKLLRLKPWEGEHCISNYGIAVDIGTTTVAAYLIHLAAGRIIDVEADVNRQRPYGADIISRINYTMEEQKGLKLMQKLIIEQINELMEVLCRRNYIMTKDIYDIALAGNTVMLHMLLGMPCSSIAAAPYIPTVLRGLEYYASELGLTAGGMVSIIPGVSGYIGSDITGGILYSNMFKEEHYSLLLDLGTNGEIVLGRKRDIVTCSTAAGPAFEGNSISGGVGGIKGAISKVDLSKGVSYETIGGAQPCGICGSGVLDITSSLLSCGVIDSTGRMCDKEEISDSELRSRLKVREEVKEFILEEQGAGGNPIAFTQKDVREVQLAKAAIRAGIELLLEERALDYKDVRKVYIGGGFGNYMNIESALNIGMLPESFRGRVKPLGNCAGMGAVKYLLSKHCREEAAEIADRAQYIELSNREGFQMRFIDNMSF
jgi:uncharacterized 2Fe-2S/4Fe-4S cluster protein (DUF4445 family)